MLLRGRRESILNRLLKPGEGVGPSRALFKKAVTKKALVRRAPLLLLESSLGGNGVSMVGKFSSEPVKAWLVVPHQPAKACLSGKKSVGEAGPNIGSSSGKMPVIIANLAAVIDASDGSLRPRGSIAVVGFSLQKQGAQPSEGLSGTGSVGMLVAQDVSHMPLLELKALEWLCIDAQGCRAGA
jgi:hypothetical protein